MTWRLVPRLMIGKRRVWLDEQGYPPFGQQGPGASFLLGNIFPGTIKMFFRFGVVPSAEVEVVAM